MRSYNAMDTIYSSNIMKISEEIKEEGAEEAPAPKKGKAGVLRILWSYDPKYGGKVTTNPDTKNETLVRGWKGQRGKVESEDSYKKWKEKWFKVPVDIQIKVAKAILKNIKGPKSSKMVKNLIKKLESGGFDSSEDKKKDKKKKTNTSSKAKVKKAVKKAEKGLDDIVDSFIGDDSKKSKKVIKKTKKLKKNVKKLGDSLESPSGKDTKKKAQETVVQMGSQIETLGNLLGAPLGSTLKDKSHPLNFLSSLFKSLGSLFSSSKKANFKYSAKSKFLLSYEDPLVKKSQKNKVKISKTRAKIKPAIARVEHGRTKAVLRSGKPARIPVDKKLLKLRKPKRLYPAGWVTRIPPASYQNKDIFFITLRSPLVIHSEVGRGWAKELSSATGLRGRDLTLALFRKKGVDSIVTIDSSGEVEEVILFHPILKGVSPEEEEVFEEEDEFEEVEEFEEEEVFEEEALEEEVFEEEVLEEEDEFEEEAFEEEVFEEEVLEEEAFEEEVFEEEVFEEEEDETLERSDFDNSQVDVEGDEGMSEDEDLRPTGTWRSFDSTFYEDLSEVSIMVMEEEKVNYQGSYDGKDVKGILYPLSMTEAGIAEELREEIENSVDSSGEEGGGGDWSTWEDEDLLKDLSDSSEDSWLSSELGMDEDEDEDLY